MMHSSYKTIFPISLKTAYLGLALPENSPDDEILSIKSRPFLKEVLWWLPQALVSHETNNELQCYVLLINQKVYTNYRSHH